MFTSQLLLQLMFFNTRTANCNFEHFKNECERLQTEAKQRGRWMGGRCRSSEEKGGCEQCD